MPNPEVIEASGSLADHRHAVLARQSGTAGYGSAIRAESANGSVAAVVVKGAGALLDLLNSSGASVLSVSQAGAISAAGGITSGAVTGDLTVTTGDLIIATAAKGIKVKEGSNATMGTVVLNGATPVTVETTAVAANSRIFLTHNVAGGTPAFAWVSARSAGVSFAVTGVALDTSTLAWLIINPAT